MIFISADLSLRIKCFIPPVVIKISFLQVTLPFFGSVGNQLYLPSVSVVSWMAVLSDFYSFRFFSPAALPESRAQFGSNLPCCTGSHQEPRRIALLTSVVKYFQEMDLGVSASWKTWQPLLAPGKWYLLTASLSISAHFLRLPKLPSLGYGSQNPVLIWRWLGVWKGRETSAFHAPTQSP